MDSRVRPPERFVDNQSVKARVDNSSTGHSRKEVRNPLEILSFWLKVKAFQSRRTVTELSAGRPRRFSKGNELKNAPVIAESRTSLWTTDEANEQILVVGKIQNLRIARRNLDGLEIEANEVFSFWRHVGRASRRKGYVAGRELREGCLIPSTGGGLCQLSNALYDAALQAGFEIIERHAHTKAIPGSLAEAGRDATVFWNYVDLRFKARNRFRIEVQLTSEDLLIRFKAEQRNSPHYYPVQISRDLTTINSCISCGQSTCARHPRSIYAPTLQTAYLLDDYWPEFDRYIQSSRNDDDTIFIPIDGERLGKSNYAWSTEGFRQTNQARLTALLRAWNTRRARHGADRQRLRLKYNERLARQFASQIGYQNSHLVIMQSLLPYLWRDGHLQGRTFDVLMTGLPSETLQQRLDQALNKHPESPTLGDFRASESLLIDEREALTHARKLVTPHSEVAQLFPDKTELLNWIVPNENVFTRRSTVRNSIAFPASTLGRKGVYQLREALNTFDVELILCGPILEDENFWQGFNIRHCNDHNWLNATAVVLPSIVESKPRRLLQAVAAGVPVIASSACGLTHVGSVTTIPTGDLDALRNALLSVIN